MFRCEIVLLITRQVVRGRSFQVLLVLKDRERGDSTAAGPGRFAVVVIGSRYGRLLGHRSG